MSAEMGSVRLAWVGAREDADKIRPDEVCRKLRLYDESATQIRVCARAGSSARVNGEQNSVNQGSFDRWAIVMYNLRFP